MCGRYAVYTPAGILEYYRIEFPLEELDERYNAAPGQYLPVVVNHEDKKRLTKMRWGMIPVWAKDDKIGYKLINARSETVFEKPTWKRPMKSKRCLIPANGFYEWKKEGDAKQPYYIHLKDQELFSFAGVFDHWTNRETGEVIESYSILTTSPNKEMKPIHDRMPVVLHQKDEDRWLDPENESPESLADLFNPYDDGALDIYPVDKGVGNARVDNESLIHALPS